MYILKFGSLEAFKKKIRVEREKFIAEVNSRSKSQKFLKPIIYDMFSVKNQVEMVE